MNKRDFALFFSLPLSPQDWVNLQASHVETVMLPLDYADIATLDRLRGMGVRVVLRVNEGDYGDKSAPSRVLTRVQACANHATVLAVIVGVEPDAPYDLQYGSPTWGQAAAYLHRDALERVGMALQGQGFVVVSPGYRQRSISEDEAPVPGVLTWAEIVRITYDACDGNAVHLYQYDYSSIVDILRVKFTLKQWQALWHKDLWLDEVGIGGSKSPVEKMRMYMHMFDMLAGHRLGERIRLFCPFVSNGTPNGQWDARFLLDDPQCYQELGTWMSA
jgi:hypothetical protein